MVDINLNSILFPKYSINISAPIRPMFGMLCFGMNGQKSIFNSDNLSAAFGFSTTRSWNKTETENWLFWINFVRWAHLLYFGIDAYGLFVCVAFQRSSILLFFSFSSDILPHVMAIESALIHSLSILRALTIVYVSAKLWRFFLSAKALKQTNKPTHNSIHNSNQTQSRCERSACDAETMA